MVFDAGATVKHRVLLELGRGGMGTVLLACRAEPGGFVKLVAVKRLHRELATEPESLQMFQDEARLAARLHHPNIVLTNDVGFDGHHYFYEMEYLEGQSLAAIAGRARKAGGLPVPLGVWILAQVAAGLHYAHELCDERGAPLSVVHRDVSPHNVLVTYEGAVKVVDFGIARAADMLQHTRTGYVKGKAQYMAPEQARREPVDRRADVFALGVMLWELLSGERLWANLHENDIFARLAKEPIAPPSKTRPDVDPELDRICRRALASTPADRHPTALSLELELQDWLHARGARIGPREAGMLVTSLFAEDRDGLRALVREHLTGAPPPSMTVVPSVAPPAEDGAGTRTSTAVMTAGAERPRSVAPARAPGSAPLSPVRRPSSSRLAWSVAALAVATLAAVAVAQLRDRLERERAAAPPTSASASTVGSRCTQPADCTPIDGAPRICRTERGTCAPLTSEDCTVLASDEALGSSDTLWIGTLFPRTGPLANVVGLLYQQAAELGRRDFTGIARGLPALEPERVPRPVGLVACDDEANPRRAALHLADDVGVPAVIGFGRPDAAIELVRDVFAPRRIATVSTRTPTMLLSRVPNEPGVPRLVWRVTNADRDVARTIAAFLEAELEPRIRRELRLAPSSPIRVAVVRLGSSLGLSLADELVTQLHFNRKSAAENQGDFLDIAFPGDAPTMDPAQTERAIAQLVGAQPHVVVVSPWAPMGESFFAPLERAWPTSLPFRPRYVWTEVVETSTLTVIGADRALRRRFFAVAPPLAAADNARFTLHYNEAFQTSVSFDESPGAPYEAFYVLAFAAALSGPGALSGTAIAANIPRVTRGRPIHIGPPGILDAVTALRADGQLALQGVGGPLAFDAATGDLLVNMEVLCLDADATGRARDSVSCGLTYDTRTGVLTGALKPPP
jgi:serine/threonine-protein kinase